MVVGILFFFLCGYFASIFMFSLAHNCFFFFYILYIIIYLSVRVFLSDLSTWFLFC